MNRAERLYFEMFGHARLNAQQEAARKHHTCCGQLKNVGHHPNCPNYKEPPPRVLDEQAPLF